MSPSEIASLSDHQIVELVTDLSQEGVDALVGDEAFAAFCELRKRKAKQVDVPRTPSGRVRNANSVELDPERWRAA